MSGGGGVAMPKKIEKKTKVRKVGIEIDLRYHVISICINFKDFDSGLWNNIHYTEGFKEFADRLKELLGDLGFEVYVQEQQPGDTVVTYKL